MIVDPLLPSAVHLTGAGAGDVLRPVIAASGGELVTADVVQVQYRPETDLVVRYRCRIRRGGTDHIDVVYAGASIRGVPAGTVPVQAVTPEGRQLSVGVWRWPFDPALPALTTMTDPRRAGSVLADLVGATPALEVIAHRPTERAVVRATGLGRRVYVKVVPHAKTDRIIRVHRALGDAGVPVPAVLARGQGWFAMQELPGTTLRDRVKQGLPLPSPDRIRSVVESMARVSIPDTRRARNRVADATHHAAMVSAVVPRELGRLDHLLDALGRDAEAQRLVTVHGDLHEAQLVADHRSIVGVLDIDDVGLGDPADDLATLVAHLRFRSMTTGRPDIDAAALGLRSSALASLDDRHLDRRIGAALIGLATGPFRVQQPNWEATTSRVLDAAAQHIEATVAVPTV